MFQALCQLATTSKQTLTYFAAELSATLAPSTIRVYVDAIGALHREHGFKDPTRKSYQLKLLYKGILRTRGQDQVSKRQPITSTVLARMLEVILASHHWRRHDRLMLTAAFTLASYVFLHVSEFTVNSHYSSNPHAYPYNYAPPLLLILDF